MKIDRNMTIITSVLSLVAIVAGYIIHFYGLSSFWENVAIGAFTGLFVSAIITAVAYFYKKNTLLKEVYIILGLMYQNFCVLNLLLENQQKKLQVNLKEFNISTAIDIAQKIDELKPIQKILNYDSFNKKSGLNYFFLGLLNFLNSFQSKTMVSNIQIAFLEYQLMISQNQLTPQFGDVDLQKKYDEIFYVLLKTKEINAYIASCLDNLIIVFTKFYKPELVWDEYKKRILADVTCINSVLSKQ